MPRTRTIRPDDDAPPADPQHWGVSVGAPADDPDDAIEETAQDRVALMLRDLRDTQSAKVRLYRKNPQSKKLAWCADYTPEEFEAGGFELIRTAWGAGNYEVRVYGTNENGQHGVLGRSEIEIVATVQPVAAAVSSTQTELATILARMADQQNAMLQALTQKPDPIAGLKETFGLMAMMREAMGINAAAQAPQKSSIGEIVDAIKELRGASELISPSSDKPEIDPDNPMSVLPQILELVKTAMAKQPEPVAMPTVHTPPSIIVPPAPTPAPVNSNEPQQMHDTTPPTPEQAEAAMRAAIEQFVGLMGDATKIEEAAELAYAELPDAMFEILQTSTWFETLSAALPNAAQHKEWLTAVRARVLTIIEEESVIDAAKAFRDPEQL